MKILLTGPQGNLGSHIISKKKEIIGLDRHDWGDLEKLIKNIDTVIHTAYDLKTSIYDEPHRVVDSNLMTTLKILEAMKRSNTKKIFFISSCAVYGNVTKMSEDTVCHPSSLNGYIKLLNERIIESYCLQNQIKYTSVRVFNAFGGNDQFSVLYRLKRAAFNNEPFSLNNEGRSQRDFIHVEDIASIILRLVEMGTEFPCINVGSGHAVKIIDLFNIVKKKYPLIKYKSSSIDEIEYARADISRLESLFSHKFHSVYDYVERLGEK